MTVQELMHELEDLDPHSEVRLAMQPSWPFEYSISSVCVINNNEDDEDDDDRPKQTHDGEDESTIYLVEGRQIGYLPGKVSNELGWR